MINTPEQLIVDVCKRFGTTPGQLSVPSRIRRLADVRSVIVKTLRDDWHMSYYQIAYYIKRDHKAAMGLYKRKPSKQFVVPATPLKLAMRVADKLGKTRGQKAGRK